MAGGGGIGEFREANWSEIFFFICFTSSSNFRVGALHQSRKWEKQKDPVQVIRPYKGNLFLWGLEGIYQERSEYG